MSTDGWKQPLLRRGFTGSLAVIGAQLSELKQSVMFEIWGRHGPYPKEAASYLASAAFSAANPCLRGAVIDHHSELP
jgi:hypothetical protein